MTGHRSPAEQSTRHQTFETARRTAGWTLHQLWISYVALGGNLVIFDLDAYLVGFTPMTPAQQDVLACALNERLADLQVHERIPYLTVSAEEPSREFVDWLLMQLRSHQSTD